MKAFKPAKAPKFKAAKVAKPSGTKKGPSAQAFAHANSNASFKRTTSPRPMTPGMAPKPVTAKPVKPSGIKTASTRPMGIQTASTEVEGPKVAKTAKPSGTNKGPSAQAFAHANANASFKRTSSPTTMNRTGVAASVQEDATKKNPMGSSGKFGRMPKA